nr:type II toxin-antitoxin system RelE/ParE family toxin [uncultured Enterobacter sp.]
MNSKSEQKGLNQPVSLTIVTVTEYTRKDAHGDHLGKYTYKKRLALPAVSPRDGARAIVFFKDGENVYFFDMYLKSHLSKKKGKELEDDEIDAYCKIAKDFVAMSPVQIKRLTEAKELIEVICDD